MLNLQDPTIQESDIVRLPYNGGSTDAIVLKVNEKSIRVETEDGLITTIRNEPKSYWYKI